MRKYLLALVCILAPVVAHAFSPVRYVQISTNSLTQQTGSFNVASGTVQGLTATHTTITSSETVTGNFGVQGAINQPLTVTSSATVSNNFGVLGAINQPLTVTSSETVNNNFAVKGAINQPLTVTSSATFTDAGNISALVASTGTITVLRSSSVAANFYGDAGNRSIYGNFVASATATGVSSITLNVSGYTGYVVRVFLTNASGAKASGLLRVNTDATTNYSYSNQGWLLSTSSGVSCGNTAANHLLLSGLNSVGNGVNMAATLNIDINSVSYYNGTTMYQESTGNNVANINMAGNANLTGITSISVWIGLVNSCTSVTIPSTGTTGRIWVWGVY